MRILQISVLGPSFDKPPGALLIPLQDHVLLMGESVIEASRGHSEVAESKVGIPGCKAVVADPFGIV